MVLQISPLSADVLKILEIFVEAEKNPVQEHELTEEEIKLIADFQDPGVQEALTLGLIQLRDALVIDLASKGPLPPCVLEALKGTPPVTDPNMIMNPNHYPNAVYQYNGPSEPVSQSQFVPPSTSIFQGSPSPPHSGAVRRGPKKRRYDTARESPFARCQWDNCGQAVENTSNAIVSHLISRHRIDLRSRNGSMLCNWADCRENLLITSVAKHITSTHLRLSVVECPYCPDNKDFSREDSLNAHIKAQHADVCGGPLQKKAKV